MADRAAFLHVVGAWRVWSGPSPTCDQSIPERWTKFCICREDGLIYRELATCVAVDI